jgi:hypothetical protein
MRPEPLEPAILGARNMIYSDRDAEVQKNNNRTSVWITSIICFSLSITLITTICYCNTLWQKVEMEKWSRVKIEKE